MPLRTNNPDVVVVGGGIAGASIATVLARGGAEVLLLERQHGYRDRVRGEYMAPWGVLEARALGLEDVIRSTHATPIAVGLMIADWHTAPRRRRRSG